MTSRLGLGCLVGCAGPANRVYHPVRRASEKFHRGLPAPSPAEYRLVPGAGRRRSVASRLPTSSSTKQAGQRFGAAMADFLAGIGYKNRDPPRPPGADCSPNLTAGARGPMQFETATFAERPGLAGIAKPKYLDPAGAIPAARQRCWRMTALLGTGKRALLAYKPEPGITPTRSWTWANRYAVAVDVVWAARWKDHPGLRTLPRSRIEGPLVYRASYYPHFPFRPRHRPHPSARRQGLSRPGRSSSPADTQAAARRSRD